MTAIATTGNAPRPGRKTNRRLPSRQVTLPEPIQIAAFWKNRRHEAIIVRLLTFKEKNVIDIRQHYPGADGKLRPTQKGLTVLVLRLPELAKAFAKALDQARELGLIDGEAST